jgi:cation-transporting ATPase 13A1
MELSLAVNNSLIALARQQIFCTEPFRIPFAGAVDVCCFDKTGTLTSDDFIVKGVSGVISEHKDDPDAGDIKQIVAADAVPADVKFVIAGCHSLAFIAYVYYYHTNYLQLLFH